MNKIIFLLLIFISGEIYAQEGIRNLSGPYLGQVPPGDKAAVFLDGLICTPDEPEMCAAFSVDFREFYFNRMYNNTWTIFHTWEENGRWTIPVPLFKDNTYTDRDFNISPDGNMILFGSNRPINGSRTPLSRLDIYVTRKSSSGKWPEPENIGPPVNSELNENYPSIAANGNLYFFTQREDGLGGCDIYVSRFANDKYSEPENLGSDVNSDKNDWDAFIAPDESYIIFSSENRNDTVGGQDLYISFRRQDGRWTKAINMGEKINSPYAEICPSVTPDGKFIFFTSRRRGKADIFWVSSGIIEKLKPDWLK